MTRFEGIWVPMVTPFRAGQLDLDAARRLARHLCDQGVHGLVVCGTTGEAATMSDEEQNRLLAAVLETVGGERPVLFGLSGNDTRAVAARAAALTRRHGADLAGLLVTAPYYLRPSQEGVRLHFEAIAAATSLPIVLYNIPYRTGVTIGPATAAALATNPQFVAIKESGAGDLAQLTAYIRDTPLVVLSGEDELIYTACCLGARGAISAAAHIRPDLYLRLIDGVRAGDLAAARAIAFALQPLIRALFAEPNPGPLKAALAMQGWVEEELRLPLTPASEACRTRLAEVLPAVMALA